MTFRKHFFMITACLVLVSGVVSPAQAGYHGLGVAPSEPEPHTYPGQGSNATSIPVHDNPVSLTANGPDQFPAGVNPLTGLTVNNPGNLNLPPAFVSVTNFPVTARPQAGLSFSPFVFEMYIGEGMTRFLAMFYGDFPKADPALKNQKGDSSKVTVDEKVGPVRSGRLPYESIRAQYGGFLVMASAWSGVASQLSDYTNVFGSDGSDVNSAMIRVTDLEKIAQKSQQKLKDTASLSGLRFDTAAPSGGQPGRMLWIPYNFLNQVIWRYDATAGAYTRFQDDADGKTFLQASDRLTQKPLEFQNVVVLFVHHRARAETLIDLDLMYQNPTPALIFRNGQVYEAKWTTRNADFEMKTGMLRPIRFEDAQGNPFSLNPGKTWVEIVPSYTPYYETVDSTVYMDLMRKQTPGSGNWAVQFFAPKVTGK